MNRLLIILMPFLCSALVLSGQNTFSFKAQVVHSHHGPQRKIRVLINNQIPAITDDEGFFRVVLPRRTTSVKITLTQGDYQVLYPFGGYIAVPRDLSDVPQLIVGSPADNIYLQQYIRLYHLKKQNATPLTDVHQKMDSLRTLLLAFRFTDTDLKKAERLQDGKDEYRGVITGDISDYLRKTSSLITTFKLLNQYALDNSAAMQSLIDAVSIYNESYLRIDRQQLNYQRKLSEYWQNDSLTNAYRDLVEYSLNKVHAEKIFNVQAAILQMKQYVMRKKKKAKDRIPVQQQIQTVMNGLEDIYPLLETKSYRVMGLMEM